MPPVLQSIQTMKENMYNLDMDELLPLCEKVVDEISNSFLPSTLFDCLLEKLSSILILDEDTAFNIYPSITGAEIEVQLLEAFLSMYFNIKGFLEVSKCLKKCWASQYSFQAVLCKKSTGLALNIPMAVIIQKVVSFRISGIISTCETATGNPSILEIREVDKAFPDTIRITRLKRDLKQHIVVLDYNVLHNDGYVDDNEDNSSKSKAIEQVDSSDGKNALSSEQVLNLGTLACKLEACFNFPLGIEWYLDKEMLFIIQVRFISFTNAISKSEVFYDCDTYIRSEDDWFSSFATGEAFSGPVTPLGMNLLNFSVDVLIAKLKYITSDLWDIKMPYFPKFLIYSHYHMMYSLTDGLLRLHSLTDATFFKTASFIMNIKTPTDEALMEFISFRYGHYNLSFRLAILKNILLLFSSKRQFKYVEVEIPKYNFENFHSASEILNFLSKNYQDVTQPFICFMTCTYRALLWTVLIFYILAINVKKTDNLQKHFNFLMSAYAKPEEGDMAFDMLVLCKRISLAINPLWFKMMPVEDAKVWLEDTEIDKKVKFSDFLKRHGHRSSSEVDIFKKCWSMDPIYLIHALQIIVPNTNSASVHTTYPLDSVFCQFTVMPNSFQKIALKYAVPKCYTAMKEAKKAKCNMLKTVAIWREALYILAQKAVKEFRIPFPEAMFFLSFDEIKQILNTEAPHLVTKAIKCWEIFADVEKSIFPVMSIGYPCPLDENYYDEKRLPVGSCLQGCPISSGTVVGTVVVIKDFCEGVDVEKGSILVTHSPTIVWSLYFPILSGFAADLGGVFSDGAVAARDWGLPCVINLVRASQVLETGDRVFLDSNTGVLRRISP